MSKPHSPWLPKLVLAPSFVLAMAFIYGLIAWNGVLSFSASRLLPNYEWAGWVHYETLWASERWWLALRAGRRWWPLGLLAPRWWRAVPALALRPGSDAAARKTVINQRFTRFS